MMANLNRNDVLASSRAKLGVDSRKANPIVGTKRNACRESVDNWPEWKKRAALSNYQFSK